jgi:hypothetical protein
MTNLKASSTTTSYDLVDKLKKKHIFNGNALMLRAARNEIRIPLGLGSVDVNNGKEESIIDIYGVILNPEKVRMCTNKPKFRELVARFIQDYINQKFKHSLGLGLSTIKINYKRN